MEVAAPPATSVPASGSATAEAPSEAAAPPSAAAAHRRARNDAPAAASRVERRRRRRPGVEYEEAEGDAAGAKACGAGGEVMPTAAMVEVEVEAMVGTGKSRAREIREVGREINDFDFSSFF